MKSWLLYALLSALCAAFVSIFGKLGLDGVDSSAATTIRAIIMALFLLCISVVHGHFGDMSSVFSHPRGLLYIAMSGIAGASSWLFYFMALQAGKVTQVAPIDKLSVVFSVLLAIILFGEQVSLFHAIAICLIAVGGLLLALFP